MKKVVIALAVVLMVGAFYIYKKYVPTGLLDVVTESFSPTTKEIVDLLPQGDDLEYAIKIPQGLRMGVFADLGGEKPRVLAEDASGVIVVSLTSSGKVVALPDRNGDGVADETVVVASGLSSPHGLVFDSGYLYIAETGRVARYRYNKDDFSLGPAEEILRLPSGGGHFTRTIGINAGKLYTTVGSSCNVCLEDDTLRATMLVSNLDGSDLSVLAKGLRNTVFFDFDPQGKIWGNDMGRDNLGDTLPPDELNIIDPTVSADYGWPWCYGQSIRDTTFRGSENTDFCAGTLPAVFGHPAHVAPLGITFINSPLLPNEAGNILTAYHGSWNSSVPVGYKIVKLTVENGKVTGSEDFITGFIQGGEVLGRPVDVMFGTNGYLYITDDRAGLVYVVGKS